jgi:hypothetical protein
VAQLGARFHGMEEVVSSNLTRSTKGFQTLTNSRRLRSAPLESNWSPKMDSNAYVFFVDGSILRGSLLL